MLNYLPEIGERCYYMHKEVMVTRVWECFHLVKIKDLVDEHSLLVDKCTLTLKPNFTNSIPLTIWGGKEK